MLKTVKVVRLAPGESLLILTDNGPNPVSPPDAAACADPCAAWRCECPAQPVPY